MGMLSNLDVPLRLEISYFYSMQGSVTIPNEFHSRKILCISQVEYQKYIYPSNIVIPYTSRHSIRKDHENGHLFVGNFVYFKCN